MRRTPHPSLTGEGHPAHPPSLLTLPLITTLACGLPFRCGAQVPSFSLQLSPCLLASIYTGDINNWSNLDLAQYNKCVSG